MSATRRLTILKFCTAMLAIALAAGDIVAAGAAPHDPPVDPHASSATQRVLDLLASRHPIISGQMLGSLDGYEATGKTFSAMTAMCSSPVSGARTWIVPARGATIAALSRPQTGC
jgi:hypothetical protein